MSRSWARDLRTTLIAAAVAGLVAAGPSLAAAFDANNADKVDGKHAVAAGATKDQRKGKLVATSATTGLLPNNILAKAPDADKLDGVDLSRLAPSEHAYSEGCCPDLPYTGLVIADLADTITSTTSATTGQITLVKRSRIMATGNAVIRTTGATASGTRCRLDISDGTGPTNGLTTMGGYSPTYVNFPATSDYHITTPLAGAAEKDPGTYNVLMTCDVNGPEGTLESLGGHLLVWAAPI